MFETQDRFVFYGIENISEKLDDIISKLNVEEKYFEIKLIMSEAITNAFVHGNKRDKSKPIIVMCKKEKDFLKIKVQDCGKDKKKLALKREINEDFLLEESGRGLYIISIYTDEVKFEDNSIVMKKSLI